MVERIIDGPRITVAWWLHDYIYWIGVLAHGWWFHLILDHKFMLVHTMHRFGWDVLPISYDIYIGGAIDS